MNAIALRRDDKAVDLLESLATEADHNVSEAAIMQLAAIATPAAIECLISLAGNRQLRESASAALARLAPAHVDRVGSGLKNSAVEVRRAVVEVLGRTRHPRASQLLAEALDDDAAPVRLGAIVGLERIGNPQNWERKLLSLARSDPDSSVRDAARQALERWAAR